MTYSHWKPTAPTSVGTRGYDKPHPRQSISVSKKTTKPAPALITGRPAATPETRSATAAEVTPPWTSGRTNAAPNGSRRAHSTRLDSARSVPVDRTLPTPPPDSAQPASFSSLLSLHLAPVLFQAARAHNHAARTRCLTRARSQTPARRQARGLRGAGKPESC